MRSIQLCLSTTHELGVPTEAIAHSSLSEAWRWPVWVQKSLPALHSSSASERAEPSSWKSPQGTRLQHSWGCRAQHSPPPLRLPDLALSLPLPLALALLFDFIERQDVLLLLALRFAVLALRALRQIKELHLAERFQPRLPSKTPAWF